MYFKITVLVRTAEHEKTVFLLALDDNADDQNVWYKDKDQWCAWFFKLSSLPMLTDLRWNNIGLLGGRSLLEALQKNKSIVKLEMAGNNIPSDTLRALGKSFIQGKSSLKPGISYYTSRYWESTWITRLWCGLIWMCITQWYLLLCVLSHLFNPFRADYRAKFRQTVHADREPQQDPGPQQGDSDTEGGEGSSGNLQAEEWNAFDSQTDSRSCSTLPCITWFFIFSAVTNSISLHY